MLSYLYTYHAELKASAPYCAFVGIGLSVWLLIIRNRLIIFVNSDDSVLYHLGYVIKNIQRNLWSDIEKLSALPNA